MLSGKRPAQPQRAGSEGLDLHQDLILRQQALTVVAHVQRQAVAPPADVPVKGDPQRRVLGARPGGTVIADIHAGHGIVKALEPLQLLPDLSPFGRGGLGAQETLRLGQGRGDPALIHHAAAFLFQLHKDLIPRLWHAVAADAQFFFIGGLFQRGPDEPEIIGIAVDVADGVFAVAVGGHVLAHFTQHCFRLRGGDKVFLFDALEAVLCSVCHIGHPFRIGWLYLKAAA